MSLLAQFEPKALWVHFDEILKIPRGSGSEGQMREYIIGVAKKNGLATKVDQAGNLVVRKPGTAGHESSPATVLQGHLDMVNEKNSDVAHDFDKDPIIPQRDGDYIKASGTTLGADNGIGLAAMLSLMDDSDHQHGPLEFLFTVDEETGLTGAAALADDMLEGRKLLNLDSEEEGELTIGCAGGGDSHLSLPLQEQPLPDGSAVLSIQLRGLKGGHSGIDIHLQKGNAVKLLARALYAVSLETPFLLAGLRGGSKHNAIPREAFAELVLPGGSGADPRAVQQALETELKTIHDEFRSAEPDLEFQFDQPEMPTSVWDAASTAKVLHLINGLPHGVVSWSYEIHGLVETSTNLGVVDDEKRSELSILLSSRSSVASALEALRQRIRATGSLAGAEVKEDPSYPGWQPDLGSPLLEVVKQTHEKVLGNEPHVAAIHAGLECGIIGEKFPGMDMISFGPQIEFPHSPDERVKIDSVAGFYRLLTTTLRELS